MPSPVWCSENGAFAKLVSDLTAEHSRVLFERDQLRSLCARSGLDVSDANKRRSTGGVLKVCARGLPGRELPVEETGDAPEDQAPEAPPVPVVSTSYLATTARRSSKEDSRRFKEGLSRTARPSGSVRIQAVPDEDEEGEPHTPRELRELRGEAELPAACCLQSDAARSKPHEGETLEVHTRWLDLYVANQLKGDGLGNDGSRSKTVTNLGMILSRGRPISSKSRRDLLATSERTQTYIKAQMNTNVKILPNSKFRVAWDAIGAPIVLFDVVFIPMQLAWDLEPNLTLIKVMLVFWVADIIVNFNTAYASQGQIVAKRSQVVMKYFRRMFWLDFFLVLLDLLVLINPSDVGNVGWYRVFRAFRVLRILRALKLSRMQETLEEMFMDSGIEKFVLFFAIGQTVIGIFLLSHLLSCGWYYLGHAELTDGSPSWLADLGRGQDDGSILQSYITCLYWTLGHVVGGNVNPFIQPVTFAERVYTLCMVAISLLVVGAGISKMTNTIADLERMNVEAKDTRRKISQVLRASGADADLCARVLRFGMHLFNRRSTLSLEDSMMGLLSTALASELTLSQRSRYLVEHPLFEIIKDDFSDVYLQLCSAFESHIYADSDVIFREGTVADCMYFTIRGNYVLETSFAFLARMPAEMTSTGNQLSRTCAWEESGKCLKFSNLRWLCEIALFTSVIHKNSLRTTSFADAFTLKGDNFANCVERSPRCVALVYRYATEYVAQLARMPSVLAADEDATGMEEFDMDVIPRYFSSKICQKFDDGEMDLDMNTDLDSPLPDLPRVDRFMDRAMNGSCSEPDELFEEMQMVFTELQVPSGIYDGLKMDPERKRSLAAMSSVLWLVQDKYDYFTMSQANPRSRLSPELWQDMQRFVRWADVSKETLRAILVFLAIRGIGKAAPFLQAMSRDARTPEDVLLILMRQLPRKVPSYNALNKDSKDVIEKAFNLHRAFNLGQFLQGENAPFHIAVLQNMVRTDGTEVLKFYLLSLVGVFCGLRGAENHKGSLFLDEANAGGLMACIRMAERLDTLSASAIYWGYIREKARMFSLPFAHLEDFAIARLACLTRSKPPDIGSLQAEWYRLNRSDREALTDHFCRDGLCKPTFVFEFLPAYLVAALANRNVGLYRALVVLVELIDTLSGDGYYDKGMRVITVSLRDLLDFTEKVESSGAFMAVHVHSSIVSRHNRLDFIVSPKHKQYTTHQNWSDDPTHEMRALMRRMDRRVGDVNRELERLTKTTSTPKAWASEYTVVKYESRGSNRSDP